MGKMPCKCFHSYTDIALAKVTHQLSMCKFNMKVVTWGFQPDPNEIIPSTIVDGDTRMQIQTNVARNVFQQTVSCNVSPTKIRDERFIRHGDTTMLYLNHNMMQIIRRVALSEKDNAKFRKKVSELDESRQTRAVSCNVNAVAVDM